MFRKSAGFKAQYQDMTLFVAPDFDEWRIFVHGPGGIIHGGRLFTEAKAKECACNIIESYLREEKHEPVAVAVAVEWQPLEPGEWLNWRP
jgi:hypothetical protein